MKLDVSNIELTYLRDLLSQSTQVDPAQTILDKVNALIKQSEPYERSCEVCSEFMVIGRSNRKRRFCSDACRKKAQRKRDIHRQQSFATKQIAKNA